MSSFFKFVAVWLILATAGNAQEILVLGGIGDLYTIDPDTGQTTFIGSTGITNMLGMDFFEDELYGHNTREGLMQLDTSTGVATDVNPNFRGPIGATTSMCFDDEGSLYYIDHALWMMDKDSGIRSAVDWIDPFGFWGEAVFVEGPKPKFSLWLDGTSGHLMGVKMAGATANGQVGIAWAKGNGGPTAIPAGFPCAGTMMNLNFTMQQLAIVTADANGKAGVGPAFIPPSAVGLIVLQAVDITTCETSNRVVVSF